MSRSRKWRSKDSAAKRHDSRAASTTSKMAEKTNYSAWSQERLIDRIEQLERKLMENNRRSVDSSVCTLC